MKKIIVFLVCLLILPAISFSEGRGRASNIYASWVTVSSNTLSTVTVPSPYTSKDVWIRNGDDTDTVCVSPSGVSISTNSNSLNNSIGQCRSSTDSFVTQLDPGAELLLTDYITSSVTLLGLGAEASPVSVIITY